MALTASLCASTTVLQVTIWLLRSATWKLVLSLTQAITLYDTLDAFVNAGPAREVGAVRGRVLTALKECFADHKLKVSAGGEARSHDGLAHMIEEYMRMHGVRFRLTGDDERESFMARRARRAAALNEVQNPVRRKDTAPEDGSRP